MAVGEIGFGTDSGVSRTVHLLAATTAADTALPTLATEGFPLYEDTAKLWSQTAATGGVCYLREAPEKSYLHVKGTTNAGQVLTATVRLYAYNKVAASWFQIFTFDYTETNADAVALTKLVDIDLGAFDRILAKVHAIAGTGTSIQAWLTVCEKAGR